MREAEESLLRSLYPSWWPVCLLGSLRGRIKGPTVVRSAVVKGGPYVLVMTLALKAALIMTPCAERPIVKGAANGVVSARRNDHANG